MVAIKWLQNDLPSKQTNSSTHVAVERPRQVSTVDSIVDEHDETSRWINKRLESLREVSCFLIHK
ncbi:hypothetical protein NEOLEDRAFT_1139295 [Neolentinus lepideus HHB14362 ss-1]|uniref:Uncharacterized protein n=1 Tax=Neolentinus lepideus HHB14362 ss-1 TaxID=1314782 RepID=A0A165PT75_9AGAM|nr:hypothetical protein NEOLEDRAFT_1139295 [Neolentinus lepideus HHB14362 ss-1]